ncbi:Asp/Glu/hydantoin racemase [Dioszegia hungarica]|uniref:Asp/Glu/hydantoin racemase n=1 Tax=Dioszegia hungarica TaxID=4972 RepID=A0AA38H1V3_9TREE|nr:Asp/Glu/hydantoin racemase [Dioszegia hungarica]KAI9632180.1 Asp/Glu/hydantoin racemase [Dioszegia hungarica]
MTNPTPHQLLIINPNSSSSITSALHSALSPYPPPQTSLHFWNPTSGPVGISNAATAASSTSACMAELTPGLLEGVDGVLICCFSEHPLISTLSDHLSTLHPDRTIPILGMFHAGVASALLTPMPFGIIATGTGDKPNLVLATANFLGSSSSTRFAGVLTSGLAITELQDGDQARVERGMRETAGRLVDQGAGTIILGCAGMSGMDGWVIDAAKEKGKSVRVVDGARGGVEMLVGMIRASR